jgi:hypothetical protein
MRSLDLFPERELSGDLGTAIRNKITRILEPPVVEQPKPKAKPKPPPRYITRIPAIEKKIALGLQLLELRSTVGKMEFSRLRRN